MEGVLFYRGRTLRSIGVAYNNRLARAFLKILIDSQAATVGEIGLSSERRSALPGSDGHPDCALFGQDVLESAENATRSHLSEHS